MARRMKIRLLLALIALLLLMGLYLLLAAERELQGDGIYFIWEDRPMSMTKRRAERPPACLFGGGGENVPADRETRAAAYDNARESRG